MKGTGWLFQAVAWLFPLPGGGLEQMANPRVSPKVDVQLRAVTAALQLNQKLLFCLQEGISVELPGECGAVLGHLPELFLHGPLQG